MGGEEFLVVLPGCQARDARLIAESLRRSVMDRPVPLPPECAAPELSVTISAGIALADGAQGGMRRLDPELLLARADRALLTAKSSGRNRIVLATPAIAA